MVDTANAPALDIRGLNVYYGASHALQGVDLTLSGGVLSVVGRNGMGKTTLCKTIMGLLPAASGSINFSGTPLLGRDPGSIVRSGVSYVPQGRRLWPSLTVDEHLKMLGGRKGSWTAERIYDVFPRLAERKTNGGGQLSGGEQQMLAIARALLLNPKLLIMDEPTEGLAPVIVDQVTEMLITLAQQGEIDILVIEQNIGVATSVSDTVAIMLNGRINRLIDATRLASDMDLQQSLLGVGRHAHDDTDAYEADETAQSKASVSGAEFVYMSNLVVPTRWSKPASVAEIMRKARPITSNPITTAEETSLIRAHPIRRKGDMVLVAGTMDTKARELLFLRDILRKQGLTVRTVDLSTQKSQTVADFPAHEIAASGHIGRDLGKDRGQSVELMAEAFRKWVSRRNDIGGIISAGGSGGTSLVTPAMRELPLGVPKVMISTVASGNTAPYVDGTDILMLNAVADIQGLNQITRKVLANGANALAGMVQDLERHSEDKIPAAAKPALGMTMFGITTPCVDAISTHLENQYECLVFHATGSGGRSMEALVEQGLISTVVDITTTEIADLIAGGIMPAAEERLDIISRRAVPYIGTCGALDTVNFGAMSTVPQPFQNRTLYKHNPNVTLMRTTAEECAEIGRWIANKLNQMKGDVRFFLPEGGVSALDQPGHPFYDPTANEALFSAIETHVHETADRQVIRTLHHINSPEFAAEIAKTVNMLAHPKSTHEWRQSHG